MTMFVDHLKTGAAVTRRLSKRNPFEVLIEIVDGDPTADHNRLFRLWWPVIQGDPELLDAVGRHVFTNYASSLDRDRRKSQPSKSPEQAEQQRQAARAAVAKLTEKIRNYVLMDMVLPNGKKLKNATFAECSAAGGWFKLLATKGKPSEVVGKKLTEDDLRKIR